MYKQDGFTNNNLCQEHHFLTCQRSGGMLASFTEF